MVFHMSASSVTGLKMNLRPAESTTIYATECCQLSAHPFVQNQNLAVIP